MSDDEHLGIAALTRRLERDRADAEQLRDQLRAATAAAASLAIADRAARLSDQASALEQRSQQILQAASVIIEEAKSIDADADLLRQEAAALRGAADVPLPDAETAVSLAQEIGKRLVELQALAKARSEPRPSPLP